MKRILKEGRVLYRNNQNTLYRTKCHVCDCEFEYDWYEITHPLKSFVACPNCGNMQIHKDSAKTTTQGGNFDTMST